MSLHWFIWHFPKYTNSFQQNSHLSWYIRNGCRDLCRSWRDQLNLFKRFSILRLWISTRTLTFEFLTEHWPLRIWEKCSAWAWPAPWLQQAEQEPFSQEQPFQTSENDLCWWFAKVSRIQDWSPPCLRSSSLASSPLGKFEGNPFCFCSSNIRTSCSEAELSWYKDDCMWVLDFWNSHNIPGFWEMRMRKLCRSQPWVCMRVRIPITLHEEKVNYVGVRICQ